MSDFNRYFIGICIILVLIFLVSCQEDSTTSKEKEAIDEVSEYLPFNTFNLHDLSEFNTEGKNWVVAGGVYSDFQKSWDLQFDSGSGVLVNAVKDQGKRDIDGAANGAHLYTNFSHGDMELEFEALVPKESNSGIYFQGRYELQLRDTAEDQEVSSDDMGGIYSQWKDNDQKEAMGGTPPVLNAARAAGLWQKFRVLFTAPKFDAAGQKISNAKFDYVYLNEYLIHENIEVSGPTIGAEYSDEVVAAPLMIQGDHGPVAIRNINYKIFTNEKVTLDDLTYKLYGGQFDYIPDFATLELIKEGTATNFENIDELSETNDGYNIVFEGNIDIPRDGLYLFETSIDDGGNTYIDDQLVVHNQGEPGYGTERGTIELTKGIHRLKQTFYQEVWAARLLMEVEGPGIKKAPFPERPIIEETRKIQMEDDYEIKVGDEPELIRAFVDHFGKKQTHILSVGTPQGVHYSYDTRNNKLTNLWKGAFADVTLMWKNRGEEQRLDPISAELSIDDMSDSGCTPHGYTLGTDGLPTFRYSCGDINFKDRVAPTENAKGVSRVVSIDEGSYDYVLATGDRIVELSDGWFSVNNEYFVRSNNGVAHWKVSDHKIVTSISPKSELSYEIYW